MTASADLHAVITEVFNLKPPDRSWYDFDQIGEERWNAAMNQYEELHPIIVQLARAVEELLSRVEQLVTLAHEFQEVGDHYDGIVTRVIESDTIKLDTYRAAIERLASQEGFSGPGVVPDNSFSGIELQARMAYAKTILEEGPRG